MSVSVSVCVCMCVCDLDEFCRSKMFFYAVS